MNMYKMNAVKPKSYKHRVYVPSDVYFFMISKEGVGNADVLFGSGSGGRAKFWHDLDEMQKDYSRVAYYRTKKEAKQFVCWLADWYCAAKSNEPLAMICLINETNI